MLREIVLDTETTGLDAKTGDRLIEIGCVEILNRIPTGEEYHAYINPETRDVHPQAEAVHGISTSFLKDKPPFKDVVDDFLAFIADAPLVIHNAEFDIGFINMELARQNMVEIGQERVIDTLAIARRKHPAGPNSLDALCKRYGIDNSQRDRHGAIIDSLLLASVYVELLGERQAALRLSTVARAGDPSHPSASAQQSARARPEELAPRLTADDVERHAAFVETLGEKALWRTRVGNLSKLRLYD
ncbi:MAG: DNA polymerase III subunit epsilon [Hyphomicrobiaceae bacterium]